MVKAESISAYTGHSTRLKASPKADAWQMPCSERRSPRCAEQGMNKAVRVTILQQVSISFLIRQFARLHRPFRSYFHDNVCFTARLRNFSKSRSELPSNNFSHRKAQKSYPPFGE